MLYIFSCAYYIYTIDIFDVLRWRGIAKPLHLIEGKGNHGESNQRGRHGLDLVCCSLVLLMTPALAMFYGGWSEGRTSCLR